MKVPMRRFTSVTAVAVGIAVATVLAPMVPIPVHANSSTGSVTVQIVPPGLPISSLDNSLLTTGTLSASIMMIPDVVAHDGVIEVEGVFIVEDYRASQCEWTVRLQDTSSKSAYLLGVDVDGDKSNIGPPPWAYEGVHAWDSAIGLSMDQSPALASATSQNHGGCGMIVSRVAIAADEDTLDEPRTLSVIIPYAP